MIRAKSVTAEGFMVELIGLTILAWIFLWPIRWPAAVLIHQAVGLPDQVQYERVDSPDDCQVYARRDAVEDCLTAYELDRDIEFLNSKIAAGHWAMALTVAVGAAMIRAMKDNPSGMAPNK